MHQVFCIPAPSGFRDSAHIRLEANLGQKQDSKEETKGGFMDAYRG